MGGGCVFLWWIGVVPWFVDWWVVNGKFWVDRWVVVLLMVGLIWVWEVVVFLMVGLSFYIGFVWGLR